MCVVYAVAQRDTCGAVCVVHAVAQRDTCGAVCVVHAVAQRDTCGPVTVYPVPVWSHCPARSHIIHIMTKYEFGWAKFKHFRGHFQAAFDQPCPEVDLKNAAKDVVDLIGAPHKQVVIFAAYNPAVKVKRQPSLERRIPRLLDQVAMIPLLK